MQGSSGSELGGGGLPQISIAKFITDRYTANRERWFSKPIIKAFTDAFVRPALGMAIARQESEFRAKAVNNTGGDANRGGSYGIMQMSMTTARSLGYKGSWEGLLQVNVCASLAAKLCAQNMARVPISTTRDVGYISWCLNMAALYNSGHLFADCPRSTREVYAPKVASYFMYYEHVLELGGFVLQATGKVPALKL
jgi:hypothetical protein